VPKLICTATLFVNSLLVTTTAVVADDLANTAIGLSDTVVITPKVLNVTGNADSPTIAVGTSGMLTRVGGRGQAAFKGTGIMIVGSGMTASTEAIALTSGLTAYFNITNRMNPEAVFGSLVFNGSFNYASSAINSTLNKSDSAFFQNSEVFDNIQVNDSVNGDVSTVVFNAYSGANPVVAVNLLEAIPRCSLWSCTDGAITIILMMSPANSLRSTQSQRPEPMPFPASLSRPFL
jgi:hypothetical protein